MIELMSTMNHTVKRGSILYLHNELFLNHMPINYKINEPPEHVELDSEIVRTSGDSRSGSSRSVKEYRFTFPKAGTYVIKVTKLAADPKNNVDHEITVIVQ